MSQDNPRTIHTWKDKASLSRTFAGFSTSALVGAGVLALTMLVVSLTMGSGKSMGVAILLGLLVGAGNGLLARVLGSSGDIFSALDGGVLGSMLLVIVVFFVNGQRVSLVWFVLLLAVGGAIGAFVDREP